MKRTLFTSGAQWLRLLFCGLWLVFPRLGWATHIVGGQLQMTHETGTTYTFGLTLYFDLANGSSGARDQDAVLAIYDKATNTLRDTITVPLIAESPVVYTNPDCAINLLETSELTYRRSFQLNAARYNSSRGYYLVWERCCRNGIITNIARPGSTGQTFYLEFPALVRNGRPFVNSSPEGFRPLADYACAGSPFIAPFGGTDPDGDSLVYDLVTPLRGNSDTINYLVRPVPPLSAPYRRVRWLPGYDSLNQIRGRAPLRVDRRTGQLSFTANRPGLYVFAIRCSEYRNGLKIGEVRREFQELVVGNCNFAPTFLSLSQPGAPTLPYTSGTVLTLPNPPASRCLNLYARDADSSERLYLRLLPLQPLPAGQMPSLSTGSGIVNVPGRSDTLLASLCFNNCFGRDGQSYRFYVVAEDDACPVAHTDSVLLIVRAALIPDNRPSIQLGAFGPERNPGGTFGIDIIGRDSDPGTRVTVQATNLNTPPLAGLGISCPTVSADSVARTRLNWPVPCGTAPGDYRVQLKVSSETCGATLFRDTAVVLRIVASDSVIKLPPNVFTPNDDGLNDDFQPAAGVPPACGQEFRRLRIFNRWGRLIFTSPDRLARWNGRDAAGGVYFYLLEYSDRTYKGWVTLLR